MNGRTEGWCVSHHCLSCCYKRLYFFLLSFQVLLLVANSIDSNADCTRLVLDGWLELVISDSAAALKALSSALLLRGNWDNLLQAKLSQSGLRSAAILGLPGQTPSPRETEKVAQGLVRFLLYTEVLGLLCAIRTCDLCLYVFIRNSYSSKIKKNIKRRSLWPGELLSEKTCRTAGSEPVHRASGERGRSPSSTLP